MGNGRIVSATSQIMEPAAIPTDGSARCSTVSFEKEEKEADSSFHYRTVIWFLCGMSSTGLCVRTFGPQLMMRFGKVMETLRVDPCSEKYGKGHRL